MLSRRCVGFAILLAAGFGMTTPSLAADNPFDGQWDVTLACPQAPDGARPFTYKFTAAVKASMLQGVHGVADQPGWLSLTGPIRPDGSADLVAHGLTGNPSYNLNQTVTGVSYSYPVTAHFTAAGQGTGSWVTTRTCNFVFNRQ